MQQIVPGVYAFTGLVMGRVYALDSTVGLTLIDAGLGLAANQVVRQLQASGRQPSDVKRILITHAHPDHIGGLARLQAATAAQVVAHPVEWPLLLRQIPTLPDTPAVRCEVQDGQTLPEVLNGLQVILTPGHTRGHVCFWQPERRLLFCGDVMMRLPRLRLPFGAFTVDMAENKRSIKQIAELQADVVCFGHGQPLLHDTAAHVRAFAARL